MLIIKQINKKRGRERRDDMGRYYCGKDIISPKRLENSLRI